MGVKTIIKTEYLKHLNLLSLGIAFIVSGLNPSMTFAITATTNVNQTNGSVIRTVGCPIDTTQVNQFTTLQSDSNNITSESGSGSPTTPGGADGTTMFNSTQPCGGGTTGGTTSGGCTNVSSVSISPSSPSVTAGGTISLTASASGSSPWSFIWKKNGITVVPGVSPNTNVSISADGSTLTITNATALNQAAYSVDVTNCSGAGSVSSAAVNLTVVPVSCPTVSIMANGSAASPINLNQGALFALTSNITGTITGFHWKKNSGADLGGTSAAYTINNVLGSSYGSYTLTVDSATCGSVTSNAIVLNTFAYSTVDVSAGGASHAASATVCAGASADFSSSITDGSLPRTGVQWKRNGVAVTGGNAALYSIASVNAANHAGVYTLDVTNAAGTRVSSNSATLNIDSPITITPLPASVNVTTGNIVNLSAPTTGSGTLTYQWKRGATVLTNGSTAWGSVISNATTSSLSITNAQPNDSGSYTLTVTDSSNTTTCATSAVSSASSVTVTAAPSISANLPAQTDAVLGNSFSLFIQASGNPAPTAIWNVNGSDISPSDPHFIQSYNSSTNTYTLTVTNALANDTGNYSVRLTNGSGSTPSATAHVTVFSSPTNISIVRSTTGPVCPNDSLVLTANYLNGLGGGIVATWWRDSTIIVNDMPGVLDLNLGNVSSADSGAYHVQLRNFAGANVSANYTVTVESSPTITSQPAPAIAHKVEGNNVTFTVGASGSNLAYQWKLDGASLSNGPTGSGSNIVGANAASITISNLQVSDAGDYTVEVTNSACSGGIVNPVALVSGSINPVVSNPATLDVLGNLLAGVTVSGTPRPASPAQAYPQNTVNFSGSVSGGANPEARLLKKAAGAGAYSLVATGPVTSNNFNIAYTVLNGDVGAKFKVEIDGRSTPPQILTPVNSLPLDIVPNNLSVNLAALPNPTTVGTDVVLTATASGGIPPYTYQFRKAGSAIAGCPDQTTSNLVVSCTLSNPQIADSGSNLRVNLSDSSSPVQSVFDTEVLTVNPPACGAYLAPTIGGHPLNNEPNVATRTQFSWTRSTLYDATSCPETYIVRFQPAGAGAAPSCMSLANQTDQYHSRNGRYIDRTYVNLTTELYLGQQLLPSTDYFWCVQVAETAGNPSPVTSAVARFTTQPADAQMAVPTLVALPDTSSGPSGTQSVQLKGGNGETGARAIFYEIVGGEYQILDIIDSIDNPNNFFITTDVNRFVTGTGVRQYVVQVTRDHNAALPTEFVSARGPTSIAATYNFDKTLTLGMPVIEKNLAAGNSDESHRYIKIRHPVDSLATAYDIYRRTELAGCVSSASVACYLGQKPFVKIATADTSVLHDETGEYKSIHFTDNDLIAGDINNPNFKGISYFAVARDAVGNSSLRSNSLSFFDHMAPDITNTLAQPLALATGRDFKLILTGGGVDLGGFFIGENQPDMHIRVWVKDLPSGDCTKEVAQSGELQENDFNALVAASYSQNITLNGVEAITVTGLTPSKPYCYYSCISGLEDFASGNTNRESCFAPSTGTTREDTTPPDFNGLNSVIALNSGTEVLATWNAATRGIGELIQYEVYYTKNVDSEGRPDFRNANVQTINDPAATSITIQNLESGVNYFFKGAVLDGTRNRNAPDRILQVRTMWVGPTVANLTVSDSPAGYGYQKVISFSAIHPYAGQPNMDVALNALEVSNNGGRSWVKITNDHIFGADLQRLRASNSINNAPKIDLIVDVLAYFNGQNNVSFRLSLADNASPSRISQPMIADPITINKGTSGVGGAARAGFGGCTTIRPESAETGLTLPLALMFAIMTLGLLIVRRRFGFANAKPKLEWRNK